MESERVNYGCKRCGLLGCSCAAVAMAFDKLCSKCRAEPCECDGKPLARTTNDVCNVCHRARAHCICVSHHSVRQMADHTLEKAKETTVRSAHQIEMTVNEGLLYYYNRDADGLAKWLRRVLR